LCVSRQHRQQFSLNARRSRKDQFSPHKLIISFQTAENRVPFLEFRVDSHRQNQKSRSPDPVRHYGRPGNARTLAPHPVLAGIHSCAGLAVGLAPLFGLALVPVLFALGHGQLALDAALAEIKPDGDERMPFDLRLGL